MRADDRYSAVGNMAVRASKGVPGTRSWLVRWLLGSGRSGYHHGSEIVECVWVVEARERWERPSHAVGETLEGLVADAVSDGFASVVCGWGQIECMR